MGDCGDDTKKKRTRFELLQGATVQERALIHHTFFTIRNVSEEDFLPSLLVWPFGRGINVFPRPFFDRMILPTDRFFSRILNPPPPKVHMSEGLKWDNNFVRVLLRSVRSFPLGTLKSKLKAFLF